MSPIKEIRIVSEDGFRFESNLISVSGSEKEHKLDIAKKKNNTNRIAKSVSNFWS